MIGKTIAKVYLDGPGDDCAILCTDGTAYSIEYYLGVIKLDSSEDFSLYTEATLDDISESRWCK